MRDKVIKVRSGATEEEGEEMEMEKENAAEKQKPHGVMWGKTKETTVLDYTMSYSRYANFASKLKNKQTTFRTVTEKNYDLSTTPFVLKKNVPANRILFPLQVPSFTAAFV